jgi:hypothetical protein
MSPKRSLFVASKGAYPEYTTRGNRGRVIVAGNGTRHVHALRPYGDLLKQASIAFVALVTPLFGALYWLTIPNGAWLAVLIAQLVVTIIFVSGLVAALRTVIWVDRTAVTERGFFGRYNTFARGDVAGAVMLELYRSSDLDSQPHLFLTDANGCLLLRMRGQFWPRAAMETVADMLGVPIDRVPEPMTLRELSRLRPELLYWFERR